MKGLENMKILIYKLIRKIKWKMYKIYYFIMNKKASKFKYVYGLNLESRRFPQIIVSMTTYPKRFEKIDLCLKSILRQSYKPDKIIIWLGSDTSEKLAKKTFDKYKKYGIEYVIDKDNNYYSHKKYIYAFKQYRNSIIVTLDDDLIYSKNTIKSLIKKYKKYPNSIIARRVHKITWNDNKINNYSNWIYESFLMHKPTHELLATTGAGTLFPPSAYKNEDLDFNRIKEYALFADDIWLKMMAVKNNVKVVWAGNFFQMPTEVNLEKNDTLSSVNVNENRNDKYIKKIMNDFNLEKKDFFK